MVRADVARRQQASQADLCHQGGREKRPSLCSWRDEEAKRGAEAFVKQSQGPARHDAVQESVGLLEEMSLWLSGGQWRRCPAQPCTGSP